MNQHVQSGPFVSVIIPVLDDYGALEMCLDALTSQTYAQSEYEVIVVDNGTESVRRRNVAREEPVPVRQYVQPRGGSYAARNLGIEHSTGQVVAFTDADCIPSPEWLREGVECLRGKCGLGLVAGAVEVVCEDPDAPTAVELHGQLFDFRQCYNAEECSFGATANVFTTRDVIRDVGRFDASLHSGGDREWGGRVARAGYEVDYCPKARVRHPARQTLQEDLQRKLRYAAGSLEVEGRIPDEGAVENLGAGVFTVLEKAARAYRTVLEAEELTDWQKLKVLGVGHLEAAVYFGHRLVHKLIHRREGLG
ncbi:MAG: glycosyltransferase family 2 protein [Bradymonadaceae bacterium]